VLNKAALQQPSLSGWAAACAFVRLCVYCWLRQQKKRGKLFRWLHSCSKMADQFVFEHVDWSPVLFANKDFAQLMKKWNLDEFVTLKRYSRGAAAPAVAHAAPYVY
jgi:hypothetical protein